MECQGLDQEEAEGRKVVESPDRRLRISAPANAYLESHLSPALERTLLGGLDEKQNQMFIAIILKGEKLGRTDKDLGGRKGWA